MTENDIEKLIAKDATPDAIPFSQIAKALQLPQDLRGLNILDVGGGGSNFTEIARRRGANPYSVDPLYSDIQALCDRVGRVIKSPQIPSSEKPLLKNSLDVFKKSAKTHPDRYVAAFASNLSRFPDNYFNLIISFNSLTAYLDSNFEVLANTFDECIKKAAPGAVILSYPYWQTNSGLSVIQNGIRLTNDIQVLNNIKANPKVAETQVYESGYKDGNQVLKIILSP